MVEDNDMIETSAHYNYSTVDFLLAIQKSFTDTKTHNRKEI